MSSRPEPGRFPRRPVRQCARRALSAAVVALAAVGPSAALAASTDGVAGAATATWRLSTTIPRASVAFTRPDTRFFDVDCSSATDCYVTGPADLAATTTPTLTPTRPAILEATRDGGASWRQQLGHAGMQAALGISCPTDTECVGGGLDATNTLTVFFTTDGGSTWTPGTTTLPLTTFLSVSCPSTGVCVGVGEPKVTAPPYRGIAVSTLGINKLGTKWTTVPLTTGHYLDGVDCPTTTECVTVGTAEGPVIFRTSNLLLGTTWTTVTLTTLTTPFNPNLPGGLRTLQSVACPSATVCVAVGYTATTRAAIISTADGGATWSAQAIPSTLGTASFLTGVSCVSVSQCEAVGLTQQGVVSTGVALVTANGGSTWTRQPIVSTPAPNQLTSVSCAGTTCVATGVQYQFQTVVGIVLELTNASSTISGRRIAGTTAPSSSVADVAHQFDAANGICPGTPGDRPAVLATDASFPDPLVSSYLAGHLDTATLVTPPARLAPVVRTALVEEGITHVYVVGGPLAVSTAVVKAIRALPVHECGGKADSGSAHVAVTRISGSTAMATAAAVAEYLPAKDVGSVSLAASYRGTNRMGGTGRYNTTEGNASVAPAAPGDLRTALLSTLGTFMDTESATAVSYEDHFPMLLTKPSTLSSHAEAAIKALHITQIVVVGGQLAVSDAAVRSLEALGVSVVRVAGIDYEGTAAEVAGFELGPSGGGLGLGWRPTGGIVVASGVGFGASVTGAVVAADGGPGRHAPEPLLLTQNATVPGTSLASFLRDAGRTGVDGDHVGVSSITLLGNFDAITGAALERMESYLSS